MTDALSFLIDPLRSLLEAIHAHLPAWALPWGWAISIIIITIMVRVVLIPLTVKQYTAMRAMQKLQPKMKELQQKYKDDRQKLNEEMMKFYKEHKVNPFGSCLPLLLQMPIFLALYYTLTSQPFDYDNAFLWISNITDSDKILVFAYIGTQFISSKLMSTSMDKTQQTMTLIMPLVMGVFFLITPFPAGVLIYWVTTNLWTIGQQLLVMKIVQARDGEAAAAVPAPVPVAAKKSGGKDGGKTKSKKRR